MPPKKSAAAPIKKAVEPQVEKTTKAKGAKAAAQATAAPTMPTTPALSNGVHTTALRGKRKVEEPIEEPKTNGVKRHSPSPAPAPAAKRPKTSASPKTAMKKPAAKSKATKAKVIINHAPIDRLNVYVFGEGSNGELGLGSAKGSLEVKRPRLNPLLAAESVGVVQVAVGGMHTIVLTNDNKILTWGINDQSALGRDTTWDGGLKDMDEGETDSDSDEIAVNPHESTPAEVDMSEVPEDTMWTQVVASDSASFALTSDGLVYGWGTFRGNDGIIGFSSSTLIQTRPTLLPDLKKVTQLSCGSNHVLALTSTGAVFAWGSGQQNQLGRRIVERKKVNGLTPSQFGLKGKKIVTVGCGSYHSFAIEDSGKVYGWGLNSYGETGISKEIGDGTESDVHHPALVPELSSGRHGTVNHIEGGAHHSICVTSSGKCLVWGRMDGFQSGLPVSSIPKDHLIYDSASKPRILSTPTVLPAVKNASYCAAGSDHCLAVSRDGKVYSWGFNATYQCGQGSDDDVEECTQIDNTAVRGKQIVFAGAGGQFSVIAGLADAEGDSTMVNGVH